MQFIASLLLLSARACRPHDALRCGGCLRGSTCDGACSRRSDNGRNGYINDYPTGAWRDAKLYEIGAGTNEIRRMLIGRELFRATAP